MLRELHEMGTVESTKLSSGRLTDLSSFDPEECCVGWTLQLRTGVGQAAIEDVFMFIDDQSQVSVRKLDNHNSQMPVSNSANASPQRPESNHTPSESPKSPVKDGSPTVNQDKRTLTKASASGDSETVRVDRRRLDDLINQIGELVIGVSMVEREVLAASSGTESSAMMQLGKIVRDLQELSLSLRMVPIAATFQKMARVVHDISRKLGKQVEFLTEGDDTELDKSVVDKIGDPLIHMVRNAVDHGIELPEVRESAARRGLVA